MRKFLSVLSPLALAVLIAPSPSAYAAEIKILAANAVKEPLLELFAAFQKSSGHKISPSWAGTEATTKRIQDGEVFDIVVIARPNIERLIAEGKLVAASKSDFAKSGVGVAVRDGLAKPDISNVAALKRTLLEIKSITYSQGPSGAYVARLFEKLEIAEQLKGKTHQTPSGVQVGEFVAKGNADLGFQQISELIHVKGIQYLGPLPPEVQNVTTYSAAQHTSAAAPDAVAALLRFLGTAEAKSLLGRFGLDPG